MNLLINIATAWVTVALMVMLLAIYALRKYIQQSDVPKDAWVRKLNRKLRKQHKWVGLAAILSAFVHGLYSSVAILSTNKGTILWVLFMALGLSFMLRQQLKQWRPWIKVHRVLAVASIAFLLLHLVEVDWFVGVQPIINAVQNDLGRQESTEQTETTITENHDNGQGQSQGKGKDLVTDSNAMTNETSESFDLSALTLSDGVYTGEAVGYQPGLVVEVTVKDQMIASVEVIEHNEVKRQFWGRPVQEIPVAIVKEQSTDVDVVSGATFTSIGIMHAVEDALKNGTAAEEAIVLKEPALTAETGDLAEETTKVSIDPDETAEEEATLVDASSELVAENTTVQEETVDPPEIVENTIEEATTPVEEVTEQDSVEVVAEEPTTPRLVDGVYMGEGYGFNPGLFVAVTIEEGMMTSIAVVDHREERQKYWGRPVIEIPKAIIETQSTEVDIVSGATYTSLGIMEAVEDALSKAMK